MRPSLQRAAKGNPVLDALYTVMENVTQKAATTDAVRLFARRYDSMLREIASEPGAPNSFDQLQSVTHCITVGFGRAAPTVGYTIRTG